MSLFPFIVERSDFMKTIIILAFICFLCFWLGWQMHLLMGIRRTLGTVFIDKSDEDSPMIWLECPSMTNLIASEPEAKFRIVVMNEPRK